MEQEIIQKAIENGIRKAVYSGYKQFLFICIVFISISWFMGNFDRDSTDSPDKRSGMILHIDNKTGCHYLSARMGIIKRTYANGEHICKAT